MEGEKRQPKFRDGPVGLKRLRAPPEPRWGAPGAGLGRVLRAGTGEVRRAPRRQALKRQPPRGRSRVRACLVESSAALNRTARTSQRGEFGRWPPRLQPPLGAWRRKCGVELPGASSPPLSFRGGRRRMGYVGRGGGLSPVPSAALASWGREGGNEAQVKDRFGYKGAQTSPVQNWPENCSCGRKVLLARCHPVARGWGWGWT